MVIMMFLKNGVNLDFLVLYGHGMLKISKNAVYLGKRVYRKLFLYYINTGENFDYVPSLLVFGNFSF